MNDMVNHPPHYKTESGMEAIDVIEAFFPHDYHLGQVFRYTSRSGKKWDEIEDLEKAAWYLNRAIKNRKAALKVDTVAPAQVGSVRYQPGDEVPDWRILKVGTIFTDGDGCEYIRTEPFVYDSGKAHDGARWVNGGDPAMCIHDSTEFESPYMVVSVDG